jgi:uncharacterized protein
MSTQVRDSPEELRFEIRVDERLAGFAQYRLKDEKITIYHAEIDPEYRGRGLGDELAHDTLEDVRRRGLVLVPRCPFIASYVRRHPDEYLDLVAPGLRARLMEDEPDDS